MCVWVLGANAGLQQSWGILDVVFVTRGAAGILDVVFVTQGAAGAGSPMWSQQLLLEHTWKGREEGKNDK